MNSIDYTEYLISKLQETIDYTEWLARKMSNNFDEDHWSKIKQRKFKLEKINRVIEQRKSEGK